MEGDPRVPVSSGPVEEDSPGRGSAAAIDPGVAMPAPATAGGTLHAPSPHDAGRLVPWLIEGLFVAGVMLAGLAVLVIVTSSQDPFRTAWIPVILGVAVVASVLRYRWLRRHESETGFVRERQISRERRGF